MKKIFAVVLSLCLVLSTFVAVSAQEQVYVEGNEVTLVDISKNFDETDAAVLSGGGDSFADADGIGGRDGVFGGAITTNTTGYVGIQLVDEAGNPVIAVNVGDVVTFSVDVYATDTFTTDTTTCGVLLRGGTGWAPGNTYFNVSAKNTVVPANEWTTLSNTFTVTQVIADKGIWLQVRPNKVMDGFYVDNLSLKVTGAREAVVDMNKTMDDASTGIVSSVGSVDYTTNPGVATVDLTGGTGNGYQTGMKLTTPDGVSLSLNAGDVVKYSVKIKSTAAFSWSENSGTTGLLLREGSSSETFCTGSNYRNIGSASIPANGDWTTVSGSFAVPSIWSGDSFTATTISVRPNVATTLQLDDFVVTVERGTEKVETGWTNADYTIDYTAKNALNNIGSFDANGDFTAIIDDVEAHNNGAGNCSYQPWVVLDTSIPAGKKFTVSYDLTTEGINNSLGDPYSTLTVRTRFYNSSNVEINSSYRPNAAVTANTGEAVHYKLAVDTTQLTQDIASVRLVLDVDAATKSKLNDDGAYFKYSNITLAEADSKVDLSVEKTADGVELTLTNSNAEKYKFAGTLFVATYNEDMQMQLFGYEAVNEEIAAGDDAVVTVTLPADIGANDDVRVFLWEADGSLSPIADWTL